jgi:transcriptional regulator NrdR family protein
LTNVRKRTGELESFDASKLRSSLTSAGARSGDASEVSANVELQLREGMATAEIKEIAARALGAYSSTAAQKYEAFAKR